MASIRDVAKKAGCSTTLVSRVINNQNGVSEESRRRILAAIDELGYTTNGLARSLVLKKTETIGIVLDTLCDAYFFDLIDGIEKEVRKLGYSALFCSGGNSEEEKNRYISFFMQGRVDGIIIYGSNLDDVRLIDRLAHSGFPFALIENDMGPQNINNILLDNQYGSRLAVDYLFRCGCRDILHVAGDSNRQAARERRDGYIDAMIRHGVSKEEAGRRILPSGWSEKEGYDTILSYCGMVRKEDLPDAFYFTSDQTAYGGMKALIEQGIRVPEDVMIIGFDDDRPRDFDFPYLPLTTIHQPLEEMGKAAADLLIRDIDEKRESKERRVFYPTLVIRSTTVNPG